MEPIAFVLCYTVKERLFNVPIQTRELFKTTELTSASNRRGSQIFLKHERDPVPGVFLAVIKKA
jgi:hypothetical protein